MNEYKKLFLIIIGLIIISNFGFSHIIEERTFSDIGYQNLIIEKNQEKCYEINVPPLKDQPNSEYVLVLDIENYIPVNSGVEIKVYLNEHLEKTIDAKNIKKRNVIKMYNYQTNNIVKICINNNFLPRIIISKESKIGNYLLAKITKEDLYQITPLTITTDSLTPIEIVFKNSGYNAVQVKVENTTDKYLINNLLSHISGEYEYEGILEAKEEKSIKYFIKTKEDLLYLSPRAKLTYTNEFGETIEILSEPALISAEEKKDLLDIFIDVQKEIINKEKYNGTIIIRNNSNKNISNIFINKSSIEQVEILNKSISNLRGKEIIEIPFTIKAFNNKDFNIVFNIEYFTEDIEYKQSEKIELIIKQKTEQVFEIVGIFVFIFIIVYIWFLKN